MGRHATSNDIQIKLNHAALVTTLITKKFLYYSHLHKILWSLGMWFFRYTSRQTNRHTDRNTSHPSQGPSNNTL